jgi:hypothetical protein
MNAYELADKLEAIDTTDTDMLNSANMLRQQADRIAELEKDLHMTERHYERLCTEPQTKSYRETHEGFSTIIYKTIPQTKPLSDEDIETIWITTPEYIDRPDHIGFARRIESKIVGKEE